VHDHVTQNPGSFAATMRGFSLLKEAGAGFIVQIIPMKDSYHQMEEMIALAKSLSTPACNLLHREICRKPDRPDR